MHKLLSFMLLLSLLLTPAQAFAQEPTPDGGDSVGGSTLYLPAINQDSVAPPNQDQGPADDPQPAPVASPVPPAQPEPPAQPPAQPEPGAPTLPPTQVEPQPEAPVDPAGNLSRQPRRMTTEDRKAAAARAAAQGFRAGLPVESGAPSAAAMGGMAEVPHYYSVPNYANSPLPVITGTVIAIGNPLVARAYPSDTAPNVMVLLPQSLPEGQITSFQSFNQTSGSGSAGKSFHAYVLRPTVNANEYTVVHDSGALLVPAATDPAGNVVSYPAPNVPVQQGDRIAFYGAGIPLDIGAGTDTLMYPANVAPMTGDTLTVGAGNYPIYPQNRTYSFGVQVLDLSGANTQIIGGMRKFVDTLPGLNADGANNLGQYIPVAQADTTTYPGSEYYEIALVEYEEQMHSDLPATRMRGYVQLATDVVPGDASAPRQPRRQPDSAAQRHPGHWRRQGPLSGPADCGHQESARAHSLPQPAAHGPSGRSLHSGGRDGDGRRHGPNMPAMDGMNGMDMPEDPQNPMCSGDPRPKAAIPTTAARCTSTAALRPGSATARPTSGLRLRPMPAPTSTPIPRV